MNDRDETPWCCNGRAAECPLCTQYGTRVDTPCPGHPATDENGAVVDTARLHAERRHPGWEYRTTEGPRKQWDDVDRPPLGDDGEPESGWERNVDAGMPGEGWERFDYTEEPYWRRRKTDVTSTELNGAPVFIADWVINPPPPPNITINGEDGNPLVIIHPNGELEYGPTYTPDAAARAFWDAMRHLFPARCPACGHIGMETP